MEKTNNNWLPSREQVSVLRSQLSLQPVELCQGIYSLGMCNLAVERYGGDIPRVPQSEERKILEYALKESKYVLPEKNPWQ